MSSLTNKKTIESLSKFDFDTIPESVKDLKKGDRLLIMADVVDLKTTTGGNDLVLRLEYGISDPTEVGVEYKRLRVRGKIKKVSLIEKARDFVKDTFKTNTDDEIDDLIHELGGIEKVKQELLKKYINTKSDDQENS